MKCPMLLLQEVFSLSKWMLEEANKCRHVTQKSSSDIWFLDSGYSNHMPENRDIFQSLDTSTK